MTESKLNVVFPIGKRPEIKFTESFLVEKDCYIYWDMESLKLPLFNGSISPSGPPEQKVVHAMSYLIKRNEELVKEVEELKGEVEYWKDASEH